MNRWYKNHQTSFYILKWCNSLKRGCITMLLRILRQIDPIDRRQSSAFFIFSSCIRRFKTTFHEKTIYDIVSSKSMVNEFQLIFHISLISSNFRPVVQFTIKSFYMTSSFKYKSSERKIFLKWRIQLIRIFLNFFLINMFFSRFIILS